MKSVKDYIPHREPFLFVDTIVELDDAHIVTTFTLREDLDFFRGHYPGQPIMPGVLMCEAVFQSAGVFMSEKLQSGLTDMTEAKPILTRITNARFRRMAQPGETIRIEVKPDEEQGGFYMMRGKVSNTDGAAIMSVDFTITLK